MTNKYFPFGQTASFLENEITDTTSPKQAMWTETKKGTWRSSLSISEWETHEVNRQHPGVENTKL